MTPRRFDDSSLNPSRLEHSENMSATLALNALGALRGEQRSALEEHMREGCDVCERDFAALTDVVESLALSAAPATPSENVRRKLLGALNVDASNLDVKNLDVPNLDVPNLDLPNLDAPNKPPKASQVPELTPQSGRETPLCRPGLLIARSAEVPWQAVAQGISCKILSQDSDRSHATCLIRAEAGARFPSHRHAAVEELLVLEGDLHMHGVVMRAGDYCRAERGSFHEETFTESGCLLLKIGSLRDEIQA